MFTIATERLAIEDYVSKNYIHDFVAYSQDAIGFEALDLV